MSHVCVMAHDPRILLDMTPDGRFSTPPRAPVTTRIIAAAIVLAVLAGALALAALALWAALLLMPIAIGAALVAYALIRFRMWRARRQSGRESHVVRRP